MKFQIQDLDFASRGTTVGHMRRGLVALMELSVNQNISEEARAHFSETAKVGAEVFYEIAAVNARAKGFYLEHRDREDQDARRLWIKGEEMAVALRNVFRAAHARLTDGD